MDDTTRELAEQITTERDHDTLMVLFDRLDRYLFETACAKPYLDEPDPGPTCTFFRQGTCGYVNGIKELYDTYGISLPDKRR